MQYPFDQEYAITSWPNSIQADGTPHGGYDFATPIGIIVRAVESFTVDFAGNQSGLGIAGNGSSGRWRYWHLSKLLVVAGQKIIEGQTIGLSGNTGTAIPAGAPHTHIDCYKNGWIDFMKLIGGSMDYKAEYEKLLKWKQDVSTWSNGVQASHVDPTLKALGEDAFLSKPFSEKIKVVSDYAKQVPGLKAQISSSYIPVGQLYVKKG